MLASQYYLQAWSSNVFLQDKRREGKDEDGRTVRADLFASTAARSGQSNALAPKFPGLLTRSTEKRVPFFQPRYSDLVEVLCCEYAVSSLQVSLVLEL